MTRRRAPSVGSPRPGCSSSTATSSRVWRCSTRPGWRRSPGSSIRSRPASCTASSCAPCRASPSTTWPRSGPRRWSGGARPNTIGSLHGRCRVHRAEILRLRGSCHEAESQALLACDELRPYMRRELGWPLNELGRIRLHRADIAGAEEAFLAAHHAGWDPQPGLALVQSGARRRGRRGCLDPRRPRSPLAGAVQGAPTEHRPAARAAARGAGRDRDRGRRHRPGPLGRRRAGGHRRPIREQGARRQRRRRSRKGSARRWRCGRRRTVLVRSGATLERGRRPVRGGDRPPRPRRSPSRQRQRAPGRVGEPSSSHDPRRDPGCADGDAQT